MLSKPAKTDARWKTRPPSHLKQNKVKAWQFFPDKSKRRFCAWGLLGSARAGVNHNIFVYRFVPVAGGSTVIVFSHIRRESFVLISTSKLICGIL